MKKYGHVGPGSTEWTLLRPPRDRMSVTRASIEILQAENALLKQVADAARTLSECLAGLGFNSLSPTQFSLNQRLRTLLAQYDGWTDSPELRDDLVQKLLAIADDLEDGNHGE